MQATPLPSTLTDTLLETVTLDAEASGFFTKYFDIPLELTQGKEQVTLKFACVDGSTARSHLRHLRHCGRV